MEQKMKPFLIACTLSLTLVLPAWATDKNPLQSKQSLTEISEVSEHGLIGKPGHKGLVTRTIEVNITETETGYMLFEPDAISIQHGAVVRFIINNDGALDHEFFLGSFAEVGKHQQWVHKHSDMEHDDPNAVKIPSGKTAELIWEFSEMTNLEFVCLIPGHREARLWGVIMVHDHLSPKSKS
jgi:uncharacterized cupredoxin-like copper-binding protein